MVNRKMKTLTFTLIVMLLASTFAYAGNTPADVKDKSYETAVSALMEKGIVTGDTDGSFHPDETLTRAQACVIVVKSMNPPIADVSATATQPVPKSGFSDMSGYSWAEGYVSYAVQNNITKGYPDGTFKPGNKVTMNELVTMVLRAADYTDNSIGGVWPENYINRATELQLLKDLPAPLPALATKWMAAQLDYNALDKIATANLAASAAVQDTYKAKLDSIPDTSNLSFATGKFNETMTKFSGKSISKDVKIYTFGLQKDYSSAMKFTDKVTDYHGDTVYKYKETKTPAFYKLENGKITAMILPTDVGYTNKVYCVVDSTVKITNGSSEDVTGLVTLTAGRSITWLCDKAITGIPAKDQYQQGELYELQIVNGVVLGIHKASDSNKIGKVFEEISSKTPGFVTVEICNSHAAKINEAGGGETVVLKDTMTVYEIDSKSATGYKQVPASSIKEGTQIRAYDISDDLNLSADVIIIKN